MTRLRLPPPTEPSVNPPDYLDGDPPEPEAISRADFEDAESHASGTIFDVIDHLPLSLEARQRVVGKTVEAFRTALGDEVEVLS